LAVSLQVTFVIKPAVGCHYFPPSPQLPSQPLRGLLLISLLGEQRHDGCEQFAQDCYPTGSRLRFEPRTFCARVQYAKHSATEPPCDSLSSHEFPSNAISTDLSAIIVQLTSESAASTSAYYYTVYVREMACRSIQHHAVRSGNLP